MDLESPPVRAPSPEELERARGVRLFFAHQSVGQNILSGVAQLSAHRIEPTPLLALAPNQALPGWVDMPVGQNGDPDGKIEAFVAAFEQHPTLRPDLALLKFCFVDFQPTTDVDQPVRDPISAKQLEVLWFTPRRLEEMIAGAELDAPEPFITGDAVASGASA